MTAELPPFDNDGLLPPGDYPLTFKELRNSVLVLGPSDPAWCPNWDSVWRETLVNNLEILTRQLWQVGITDIYADGSFAEDKDHPSDIDGYFVCDLDFLASGRLQRELNLLDPLKSWTWEPSSRKPHPDFPKRQLPMWHHYRVELYPHVAGLSSGIQDQYGNELEFPAAFRRSRRNGRQRGIIKLCEGAKT